MLVLGQKEQKELAAALLEAESRKGDEPTLSPEGALPPSYILDPHGLLVQFKIVNLANESVLRVY